MLLLLIGTSCNRCLEGCINGVCKKGLCDCNVWYTGDRCDRSVLQQHASSYEGTMRYLPNAYEEVEFQLIVSPLDPSVAFLDPLAIECAFNDETRFSIPQQAWRDGTIEGSGEMLLDLISAQITYTPSDTTIQSIVLEASKR